MPLSVKDGMGVWIKDFQKSNAPQFKGKSDKERREMAMAAYLDAKKNQKDESYVSMAQQRAVWATRKDGGKGHPDKKNEATDKPPFTPDPPEAEKKNSDGTKTSPMSRAKQLAKMARDRNMKNEATVDTADIASKKAMKKSDTEKLGKLADMLAKERKPQKESVELEEAHAYAKAAKALHDYGTKNGGIDKKDFHTAAKHLDNVGKSGLMQKGNHLAKFNNHLKYLDTDVRDRIHMTLKQHGVMEGTQLDELSPATHKSYQAKAFTSGARGMAAKRMGTMSAKDAYDNEKKRHAGIELSKSLQRRDARKKRNEEVEEATYGTQAQRMMSPLQKIRQDKEKADRDRDGNLKKVKLKGFGPDAAKGNMGNPSARAALKPKKEETQVEAVSYHGNPNKDDDARNAARRKRLAKQDNILKKRAQDNEKARQALKDPSHNPAWANSKSKTEETVSELKKSTLGSYVNKASKDAASKAYGAASAAKDNNPEKGGKDFSKSMKRLRGINTATKKLAKEDTNEAKSFDQKFRDHLKFSMSKSPAVQAYMKKRRDDRDARHAKQDPAAVKKNYGPAVIPPGTAYNKASKKGMNPSQAANAVSTAFKNRAKRGGKLPK